MQSTIPPKFLTFILSIREGTWNSEERKKEKYLVFSVKKLINKNMY